MTQLDPCADLLRVLRQTAEALALADLYLDGFVWLGEPEVSELRRIKRASRAAQAAIAELVDSDV